MYIVARRKILFYDGHTALNIILFSGDSTSILSPKSRFFDPISHLLVLDLGSKMVVFDGFEHELWGEETEKGSEGGIFDVFWLWGVIFDGFWAQKWSFLMVFDIKMTPFWAIFGSFLPLFSIKIALFWLVFGLKIAVFGVKNGHFLTILNINYEGRRPKKGQKWSFLGVRGVQNRRFLTPEPIPILISGKWPPQTTILSKIPGPPPGNWNLSGKFQY